VSWQESATRRFAYRAFVKGRVELERRSVPLDGAKRVFASPAHSRLSWLAAVYGSDKGATAHRYAELYEQHLKPLRREALRVLEIGVYRGASLQMWRDFFPHAEIFGVDIEPVTVSAKRIHVLQGDQADPALLARLRGLGPFDLIVDDGSHRGNDVLATFEGLFAAVRPGGFYVIEDMHTAYQAEEYGGGPPGRADTSVALVQRLVDAVNRALLANEYPEAAQVLPPVASLHVYPKIAFIRRADDHEGPGS
jgi:hypothetical protein